MHQPHTLPARRLQPLGILVLALVMLAAQPMEQLAAEDGTRWVEVQLNDGTAVTAPYVGSTRDTITVFQNGANREIAMDLVKVVNYLEAAPARPPEPAPAPVNANPPAAVEPAPAPQPATATPAPPVPTTPVTPFAIPAPVPPTTEPPAIPPPAEAADPNLQYVEFTLPGVEAGKTESVKLLLSWSKDGPAPWYKLNRASSLHQMPGWNRATAQSEKDILAAIEALADPEQTAAARRKLAGMVSEAAPYMVIFLLDTDPRRAQVCAELLLDRGNRDVAKYFIEALHATTDEKNGALAPWLQPYAAKLLEGCKKFTDTASGADPAKAGFSAAEFVTAWQEHFADAVPQLGEPEYKPERAPANAEIQKAAWIAFFRTLALKRVQFVEPAEEKVDLTRVYPRVKDAALDRSIQADLARLAGGTEAARREAKERLQNRTWQDIAQYVAQALAEKRDTGLRLILLDMVNTHSDKGFTWQVLNVLVESWGPPTAVPGPNHAALIRASDNLLRKLTGITGQPAVQPTFIGGYKPIQGYIEFWNAHFLEFPPQYGEPELDKTKPKYNEYLKELRLIKSGAAGK